MWLSLASQASLAEWLSVCLRTKWLWVRVPLQSLSVNLFYLIVHEVDSSIEEKVGHKYLDFAFTDSNSEVLKTYTEIWGRIKDQIEKINSGKSAEYGKNYVKIKFNSDDDLPLKKQLKFINLTGLLDVLLKRMVHIILTFS